MIEEFIADGVDGLFAGYEDIFFLAKFFLDVVVADYEIEDNDEYGDDKDLEVDITDANFFVTDDADEEVGEQGENG